VPSKYLTIYLCISDIIVMHVMTRESMEFAVK